MYTDPRYPNYVVRRISDEYEPSPEALDPRDSIEAEIAQTESEYARLRRNGPGLCIPTHFYVPYFNDEEAQPWAYYSYATKLEGTPADPTDPQHAPYLKRGAAVILNYLIETPEGGRVLDELCGGEVLANQLTIGRPQRTKLPTKLYFHDTDTGTTPREPFVAGDDGSVYLSSVEMLEELVNTLPPDETVEYLAKTIQTLITTGQATPVQLP